jgi:hypothetical protein
VLSDGHTTTGTDRAPMAATSVVNAWFPVIPTARRFTVFADAGTAA